MKPVSRVMALMGIGPPDLYSTGTEFPWDCSALLLRAAMVLSTGAIKGSTGVDRIRAPSGTRTPKNSQRWNHSTRRISESGCSGPSRASVMELGRPHACHGEAHAGCYSV